MLSNRFVILLAQRLLLVAVFAIAWWYAAGRLPSFVLPGPEKVFAALNTLWHSATFVHDLSATMGRVFSGFALAALIGTPLGLALGSSRTLAQFFEPILAVFNTVSSAIWAIFAIIWFGISDATTVFVVFMTSMPLILTNVWQGTRTVNTDFVELARTFRMSKRQVLTKIYVPTILPLFFAGARLAFGFGARVSIVAETLGASSGIGYRLRQAADLVQTDQVFAWTLTLVTLMIVIESLVLKPLERHLFSWRERSSS